MDKETYYRIREEVYKNAGNDKFDFDLMLTRVVTKAVEEEREACAKVGELVAREIDDTNGTATYIVTAIRARGQG